MTCPHCGVYDVDSRSDRGWCIKCTGVFTDQKLTPMCMLCHVKPAHPDSEIELCLKCHFDMKDEVLL